MKKLSENPVFLASKHLPGVTEKWLTWPGLVYLGIMLAVPSLILRLLNVCSCTVFTIAGVVMILLSVLLVGSSALHAISREREKKTLDSLRVTTLFGEDVILGKLLPEFFALCRLLIVNTPTILLLGITSEYGITGAMAVLLISVLSGTISLLGGIILSCICRSTSQAIVIGWTLKLVWLIGTLLIDMVCAAVTVSRTPPPVFSSISPLLAFCAIVLPQAMDGPWIILPWSFFILTPLFIILMWYTACHIYAIGGFSSVFSQRKAHEVFISGWGPSGWLKGLFPSLSTWFSNPAFLREISLQLRHGAGRLPGYLVFVALFIAPYLYARCWGISEYTHGSQERPQIRTEVINSSEISGVIKAEDLKNQNIIRTPRGFYFILKGHTLKWCMRLTMYKTAGIPLPEDRIQEVEYERPKYTPLTQQWDIANQNEAKAELTKQRESNNLSSPLSDQQISSVDSAAMKWGLIGAIWLMIFYIAVRGCCFTIATVTGECDRRTWEDLALAGLTPRNVLAGKLMGALSIPLFQMTIVFPMLLFFVFSGNLGLIDVISFYLYSALIIITSGILGVWASATSPSTHEAQGKALGLVFLFFLIIPLFIPLLRLISILAFPIFIIATLIMCRNIPKALIAWVGISLSVAISAVSLSPLLAPLSFLPTISQSYLNSFWGCIMGSTEITLLNLAAALLFLLAISYGMWYKSISVLTEKDQKDVLKADLPQLIVKKDGNISREQTLNPINYNKTQMPANF